MADLQLNSTNGSITLSSEDGTGNVNVVVPREGFDPLIQSVLIEDDTSILFNSTTYVDLLEFSIDNCIAGSKLLIDVYTNDLHENTRVSHKGVFNSSDVNIGEQIVQCSSVSDWFSVDVIFSIETTATAGTNTFKLKGKSSASQGYYNYSELKTSIKIQELRQNN